MQTGHAVSLYTPSVRSLMLVEPQQISTFAAAARTAADLATHAEVTERWADESACAGMSVGGLANHLVDQVTLAVRLLEAGASDLEPIPLDEHYARAAWVHTDLDSEANTGIREGSDQQAEAGPGALRARLEASLARLPETFGPVDEADPVLVPWQGWALTAEDFLTTRTMELMVHSDDLAASVGLPTPEFPDEAASRVFALLNRLAVRRHGQAALVRTLTRPQRAPESVSAF
jgi:Mycothiol maleylpyruvate isomerase N-terminal domain